MKYLVAAVMIIFVLFMGSTVTYGFIQKQQKEAELKNTPAVTTPEQPQQPQPATTPNAPAQPTGITAVEVAKHNKASDCWIIISAKVYDVGKFLELHPGGADMIIPYCGKDATQAFNTQGGRGSHSAQAKAELQKYLLGPLQ